jgi:putative endonuclease
MTFQRKSLGKAGEDLALQYLKDKGYTEVKRNLKLFCGEIDLLMEDGKYLVICEVKTKSSDDFGTPQEEVDYFKRKKLIQLGKALWQLYPNHSIRIDVVAVDTQNKKIDHIINAVEEN